MSYLVEVEQENGSIEYVKEWHGGKSVDLIQEKAKAQPFSLELAEHVADQIDAVYVQSLVTKLTEPLQELNDNQMWLLKDFRRMWGERDLLNLSGKTSAVFSVLESDACYKVSGLKIDEVVQVFLAET